MNNPQARVTEFLRQYKLGSGQHHVDITGVHKDVNARMAMLTVPDLEALVAFVDRTRLAIQNNQTHEGVVFDISDALETLDDLG